MDCLKPDEYCEPDVDINLIESYMSRFGEGNIVISKEHWNEGIALLQICNIEKKNAISGKMMVDLRNCVAELEAWKEGQAVILYGQGDNFCSGGDLDFARNCSTTKDGLYLSYLMQEALSRLKNLPIISIALLHGPTLGGGAEVAVACDYILACDNVKFGFVHGKMGIITAWGGTTRLVKVLGEKKALDLLLSSRLLNANDCANLGLAEKVLKTENMLDQCLEWTRNYTRHHFTVTRSFKLAATIPTKNNFKRLFAEERKLFSPLWGAPPNREALNKHIKHLTN